ncbi:hypothetical protein BV22DRAFT_986403, partial [Leucogyrophana mollusca]
IVRLSKDWNSPIYAFFVPTPTVRYLKGRCYHEFHCMAKGCKEGIRRYLDTKDAKSTSNMRKHVRTCWGEDVLNTVDEAKNATVARDTIITALLETGTITAAFERKGKGKVTYSHRQHTKTEAKCIVNDRGFQSLMKTGRPDYYIPSPSTVSRDVKLVFARVRQRIAGMLQKYDGNINFATDAWTSPNHRPFVAVTAHLEHEGRPLALLLDIVGVSKSHTGPHLAAAF